MFVPAPRSLDYVSDRMPNIEYAHGLVAVVEGMHLKTLIFLKYSIVARKKFTLVKLCFSLWRLTFSWMLQHV